MKTEETNKLIAEFLGFKERVFTDSKGKTTKTYSLPNPKTSNGLPLLKIHKEKSLSRYSTDWNWLMEVVEKIEDTRVNNIRYIDFHIMPDAVIVTNQEDEENPLILINKSEGNGSIQEDIIMFETKIQAVYNACVEFIKWYNEQNSANKN